MNKNKLKSIIIISLFVVSMFYFNPENTLNEISEELQINEQINDSKLIDDSIIDTPTRSVIDYEKFYLGESISTDIEFNKQGLNHELANWYSSHASTSYGISQTEFMNSFSDDTDYWQTSISWGSAVSSQVDFSFTHKIYCGGAGDLYFDYRGEWLTGAMNTYLTAWTSGTKAVDSSDLDAQGYLYIEFWMTAAPVIDKLYCYIYMHTVEGSEVVSFVQKLSLTDPSIASLTMWVDYFYFQRDTITNNVRSEYKYNSPTTKTHRVNPPSITFVKEMNIYYDETRWTYSSITPYASVTDTGGVLTINSPTEIDYEILFLSTCQNHLAIKDVSTSFLSDVGFEGSTDIYTNWVSNPFETFETSTEQSFAGYSSLKTVQNSGTYGISYVLLSNDYYYVSCWAYIDSITGGAETVSIAWWNGTAWNHEYFDDTIIDRWQNLQFYMQIIDDDSGRNFQFYVSATTATVYFDYESLLFQTSTTIETFGYSESMIESTLISWDGYKNPLLEGQQTLNTTLLERSSQTSIYSTNLTSTTGIFELLYDQALEQKEYEIWTYSYSSGEFNNCSFYFTPSYPTHTDYAETVLNDAWDFSEGDTEGWSPYSSTSDSVENGYWEKISDTAYSKYYIQNIDAFDETYYTVIVFGIWSNVSQTISFQQKTGGIWGTVRRQTNHDLTANTWTIITVVGITTYDIDCFVINTDINVTPKKVKLDYVELVHVDSWLEETNDYATDQLLDAWDFEEYDSGTILDGWQESVGGQTIEIENGCFKVNITSTDAYTRLVATGLSISASTYTRIEITIKTNEDSLQLYFAESDNQAITAKTEIGVANVFHKLIFDIDDTDWSGTETALYLWLYDSSGNFEADEFFWIEEIRLIHLEEMPYTTIQNSVLLESETNDLQYNLYLDHNLIGTFSDLSLIPIPQTAGTHYLSVQPFRTDEAYSTQQIFSYYYTVEAAAFSVSVENFYLSDDYANLFVTSNYNCSYEITSGGTGSGNIAKEGTTISVTRITTPGSEVTLTIDFTYGSETVTFSTRYNNPVSAFYVSSYTIDIQEENIEIIWSTSKSTIDSLTVYEDGSLTTVNADTTSPSSWTKSSTVGVHYVTLIFSAAGFQDIIYSFNYEIVSAIFEINIESFHLSELYVNTYITASENGNYQVYENNTAIPSDSPTPFFSVGTSIQTDRDTTEGAFINYAIKFWNAAEDTIWFNTTYSNTEGVFFVTSYSVNIGDTTITVTWATSLIDSDKLTVYEDGALTTVNEDTTSPSAWSKSTVVGTHSVTLLFEADGYTTVTYSFNYHIYAVADFQVDIGSFQVSDNYVNTYASANYDGTYYVYEDNVQIDTDSFYGAGTNIETSKDTTAGSTMSYAIKFVYESTEIWFNTTYSNPVTPFYLTDYRVEDGTTITVTWDTTLPALDSLTIYEDGVLIEDGDTESTTTWVKSTDVGNHYVTLIFSAAGYDDIIHSFAYTVYPPTAFSVYVDSFYVSDDYLNVYLTATHDYTYIVYENDVDIGSGNGIASGTIIISPKNRVAGLYNFTIIFTYESTNRSFMTWYSNLIPPLHPSNDLYRTDSQGFYNISLYTNLEFFWVDVWHDSVLIIDDSSEIRYSIPKALKIGLHNITLIYSYNISTDSEGYPLAEYNATISYEFWYETKLFYDIRIRYVPTNYLGLAIGDAFEVSWVNTYFNGKLIFDGEIDDVPDYSNYTFIANDYIRIRNNMPIHNLTITDLFGREIMYNLTIDISSFAYAIIELPVYRLGVVNNDDESHKISIRSYLSGEEWQTTPILPPGYQTEYWICNRTYEIRILSVGSTTYDENGAMVELYDDITDYPELRTVPYVIVIPLDLVFEPEEEEVIDKWWTKPAFIAGMSAIALIIILVAIYIVNKNVKKKERLNK